MNNLSYYDIIGVVTPGALVLFALALANNELAKSITTVDVTLGGFGLFIVASYVAGQLIQACGNALEWQYWRLWGGWPSDWIRTGKRKLLSPIQKETLLGQLAPKLGLVGQMDVHSLSGADWRAITSQVSATVRRSGESGGTRFETFNAIYGLNRGMATASLLSLVAQFTQQPVNWFLVALSAVSFALFIHRMHRFGKYYAVELYVQFLTTGTKLDDPAPLPDQEPQTIS